MTAIASIQATYVNYSDDGCIINETESVAPAVGEGDCCGCERSQRASASSIAPASCWKVWLRAAAKIRPGRGQYCSPWPSIRSTRIEAEVRATSHLRCGHTLPGCLAW
jgi:hypothetical protein